MRKKVTFELSKAAKRWLAEQGHDPVFGARPLARVIQTKIKTVLADEILFGELEKGGKVFIELKDDELTFSFSEGGIIKGIGEQ